LYCGSHSELRIEAQLIAAFPKCQQSLVHPGANKPIVILPYLLE